jgi:hypothetical protein
MVWFSFIDVSSKNWLYHGTNYQVDEENITFYLDHTMSKNLGSNQEKVHGSTNSSTSKLANGISYAHGCIIVGNRCNVGIKPNW